MTAPRPAADTAAMTTAQQTPPGSAAVEGRLWGERARDFTTQESKLSALYTAVLDELGIGDGAQLLDVGCGAGLFLKLAEQRGATVSGVDAAARLIEIARERLPRSELVVGDIEQLPFLSRRFDIVTGFDAFRFAASPRRALAEAGRVAIAGAPIAIAAWGRPDECEAAAYLTELGALLPQPSRDTAGPFTLSAPGALERFAADAGLVAGPRRAVLCVWEYEDEPELLRALTATGLAVSAIHTVGEDAVTRAIRRVVAPYKLDGGGYRLENIFDYVIARAA